MKHIIIMPAHNETALIGRTLQSIVDQTERPDRLIVVDDGSTDTTAEIVRGVMQDNPWIEKEIQWRADLAEKAAEQARKAAGR